jgi:choline dehydrogenase-like flavoprotein
MFIDARSLAAKTVVQTGVCIIGAGAAGITLARSLRTAGFPVVLLESGDLDFDPDTQDLEAGDLAGIPNYPLDVCRLRFFGGTTNHWAGTCRPLDPADFEPRPAIPLSGWPLKRDDLLAYYRQAQDLCQLGPFDYDPATWIGKTGQTGPKFDPTRLRTAIFQISPPTRFGQTYREDLRQSETVTVYLNANAVDLEANATASAVESVKVATLGGPNFSVRAKYVVLATGGLENARILLLSRGVQAAGLGNTYDLVGRYFMDHPYFSSAGIAQFAIADPSLPLLLLGVDSPVTNAFATLAIGEPLQAGGPSSTNGIAGFQILCRPMQRIVHGVDSLKTVAGALRHFSVPAHLWEHLGNILHDRDVVADSIYRTLTGRRTSPFVSDQANAPVVGTSFDILVEQTPNPASRVTLSTARDALGQNRIVLDWQLTEIERRTYRRAQELIGLEFGRLGIGRVNARKLPEGGWPADLLGANHHMGTTRMSNDPKTGVVDADGRIHGVNNLYVAGSSVFPTSGYANPTLTIVALALRLGDEIRRQMA